MNPDHPPKRADRSGDEPSPPRFRYDGPHAEPRAPLFVRLDDQRPDDEQR